MSRSTNKPLRTYRVLLIAEAANPEWASVPLTGWSLSRALMTVADAHLVTHVRNREALVRAGLSEGRDFTAINNEATAAPLWKLAERLRGGENKGWTTVTAISALAYYSFERELYRQLGSRIEAREWDIVHRVIPKSPTHQSPIAKRLARLNIPFIIGPINGGVPWPKKFIDRQHAELEWLSHVRGLYKLMPSYRATYKYSSAIIAGSKYNLSEIPIWAKGKSVYIPANGVDMERFKIPRSRSASLPLKVAFVGRLVPYKGADMLLEATSEFLRKGQLEVHIIGDGPQRGKLEAMVDKLGVKDAVRFLGWLPHLELQEILRVCDLMAFPSIREFGGAVVIEAMAMGVAPMVADYGGPPEFVDEKTGFCIGFDDKKSLIEGVRQALATVVRSPEILDELGSAARKKVLEKLTWEAKANQIAAVYDDVLTGGGNLHSLHYR